MHDDVSMSGVIALPLALAVAATAAGSPLAQEAVKLLRADRANAHTLETQWNGNQTVFVDYPSGPRGEQDRDLYAVQRQAGRPQAAKVTVGEHNGGDADVAAIGFANGDRDAAKELVIILTWDVNNAIVGGTFYQVQVFDDWKRGQRQLKQLRRLSAHFGSGCDCALDDGTEKHFRFKTVAEVRRELKRLGY